LQGEPSEKAAVRQGKFDDEFGHKCAGKGGKNGWLVSAVSRKKSCAGRGGGTKGKAKKNGSEASSLIALPSGKVAERDEREVEEGKAVGKWE